MKSQLKTEFEEKYADKISTTKGIEILAQEIGISKNSLRRFLGKLNSDGEMRISTLNYISVFLGYKNFHSFSTRLTENITKIDLDFLEVFYEDEKGKGIYLGETRFQNINYKFAEKIILNQNILSAFLSKFSRNPEALEYVLAFHPSYGRIAEKSYQDSLQIFSQITTLTHLKVFAASFKIFGKFMQNDFENENEIEKELKNIKKNVGKMRLESELYYPFTEVRFAIAKVFFYHKNKNELSLQSEIKNQTINNNNLPTGNNRLIHQLYFADALNLIGKYDEAETIQSQFSKSDFDRFCKKNYYQQTHMILFKVSRAISLYKTGHIKYSKETFKELSKLNHVNLPFDTKDYFLLQYYLLGTYLFPKNKIYVKKLDEKIMKTGYYYFGKLK